MTRTMIKNTPYPNYYKDVIYIYIYIYIDRYVKVYKIWRSFTVDIKSSSMKVYKIWKSLTVDVKRSSNLTI